jgi:hypothetical protein
MATTADPSVSPPGQPLPSRLYGSDGMVYGVRVAVTEHCFVELEFMAYGDIDIIETDRRSVTRRWRYELGDMIPELFLPMVLACAQRWPGTPDTEPEGWHGEIISRRYRPDADPAREYVK